MTPRLHNLHSSSCSGLSVWWLVAGMLLASWALGGCESTQPKSKEPARLLYLQAQALGDQDLYSDAIEKYNKVIEQNPGTLLASFAYLKLAEINELQEKWEEAETNYRIFLTLHRNSGMTSYVLYRLIVAQHERSFTGVFFKEREVDRDMAPNRKIMREYTRFFFLYPKSVFLDEVSTYYRSAQKTLAEYEQLVGEFYFDRGLYNAAAFRFYHLLRNFPDYPNTEAILIDLIKAYRRNQQPELAEEMERILQERFRTSVNSASGIDPVHSPTPPIAWDDNPARAGGS